jgi:hypothetical protein
LKRILIISPHFPPLNAADMQRVRMSLPYYAALGWEAEVVAVHQSYAHMVKDDLLLESIPNNIKVHHVKALQKKFTSKLGLGSLALRAMWFYKKKVNELLKEKKFDLIFFSTTEFPICVLGAYWKKKFNIPYLIDMQDPWHTDYYKDKPKAEQPKKFWFSYRMHRFLEPIAMNEVDGIISVSAHYIHTLQQRYPHLIGKPCEIITFGAFNLDFEIVKRNRDNLSLLFKPTAQTTHLIYVGRAGYDMRPAIEMLMKCLEKGLENDPELFSKVHFHFIGTSYAPAGQGTATVAPIAAAFNLSGFVTEYTDRIGYYSTLQQLIHADGLVIIGSNEAAYNASKIFPYVLAKKPLLAVFHPDSVASQLMKTWKAGELITLEQDLSMAYPVFKSYIEQATDQSVPETDWKSFEPYTAAYLAQKQVQVFNQIMN